MTDFKLRPYQIDALNIIHEDLKTEPEVLFQAIMGAGKTVTIARLINRYWFETDRRFLILAHKQELVEQFFNAFKTKTDISPYEIGVCCAGLNQKDLQKRLTIGSVQTFCNVVNDYPGADLLAIDECHRVSVGKDSQYDQVINSLRSKVPNMRILGCTATVGRLGHGYIYGDRHVKGGKNLFPRLNHQIKYQTLLDQGYLCKMKGLIAHADSLTADLETVEVNGDYVLNRLGEVMSKQIHLSTAVDAIREHCKDFNMICVFCCTIDHAERLRALLGDEATTIHSQLSPLEREINMQSWLSGKTRICTSVNILTEGIDIPQLDCLAMARPTLSSTLFLQAVGRLLRLYPGKDYGFLLDLTDNTARFGTDLDNVKVAIPQSVKSAIEKDRLSKICPSCEREVFVSFRTCPHCKFEWPVEEIIEANQVPDLKEVSFKKADPVWMGVIDMRLNMHESKKSKKYLGKVSFYTDNYYAKPIIMWFCMPDFYSGYAVEAARKKWEMLMPSEALPETVDDFVKYQVPMPEAILVDITQEWPEVLDVRYDTPDFFVDKPFMDGQTPLEALNSVFDDDPIPF